MLFNIAINTSDTIQSFPTKSSDYVTIHPNQATDASQIYGETEGMLEPIGGFLHFLKKKGVKKFYVHRSYAAGDILILIPVIRALRKQGYSVCLRTSETWKPFLDLLNIESQFIEHRFESADYGINLDGTLEADHYRKELSVMHRCDIYREVLGMKKTRKLDWSMDLKKLPEVNIKNNYIVFQYRGSTRMKQLPVNTANWIVKAFEKINIPVIRLGEEKRMSIEKMFALIAKAKCLITMDSAPLWCSHFTSTPTIGLFGPTQPQQRITYHPLYPKGMVGIRLNECLSSPCESCFEQTKRCGGRMDCLHIKPEKMFELIQPHVLKFWGEQ